MGSKDDRNVRAHKVLCISSLLTKLYESESSKRFAYRMALDIEEKLCGVLDSVYDKVYSSLELALILTESIPKEDLSSLVKELSGEVNSLIWSNPSDDVRFPFFRSDNHDENRHRSVGLNH